MQESEMRSSRPRIAYRFPMQPSDKLCWVSEADRPPMDQGHLYLKKYPSRGDIDCDSLNCAKELRTLLEVYQSEYPKAIQWTLVQKSPGFERWRLILKDTREFGDFDKIWIRCVKIFQEIISVKEASLLRKQNIPEPK